MKNSNWKPLRTRPVAPVVDPTMRGRGAPLESPEQRQPPSPYDHALNRSAATWLEDLPEPVRPRQTAARFPRILNRLARYWDTPVMTETIFNDLLLERRLGRKGFPPEILAELRALYVVHKARVGDGKTTDVWSSVPDRVRAPPRRR